MEMVGSSKHPCFLIRTAKKGDLNSLRKLIRGTRYENIPDLVFKQIVLHSFKIQVVLLLVASLPHLAFNLHFIWSLIFYSFLVFALLILNNLRWKKHIRGSSLELESWQDFSDLYLKPAGCLFIVATTEINNEQVIAGCVGLRTPSEELAAHIKRATLSSNSFEVMRMGVFKPFRRLGLAKLLMQECENRVQNRSHFGEFNFVLACNEGIPLKMYTKFGYNIVHEEQVADLLAFGAFKDYVLAKSFQC